MTIGHDILPVYSLIQYSIAFLYVSSDLVQLCGDETHVDAVIVGLQSDIMFKFRRAVLTYTASTGGVQSSIARGKYSYDKLATSIGALLL